MPPPPASALIPPVTAVVRAAGAMLAAEFCRPGGPRFSDHSTAPVDYNIEIFLRRHLTSLLPARFVGEEDGVLEAEANGFCWLVDPHDGTRAYIEGRRGSAVSVALLRQGTPVLGVVFAPLSPDRGPDLIAWAEGAPITRNGESVRTDLRDKGLSSGDVVFLNHGAWQRPVWHGTAVAPGRFVPLPSIAYRLARVAVGDGVATLTLRPVNALDIAAGHALVGAAGGVLVTEDGMPVTYSAQGESRPSACFGGAPAAVAALRARRWRGSTEPRREAGISLGWPRQTGSGPLDRAIGCLLGLIIGGSLGCLVKNQPPRTIASAYPAGIRELHDRGAWDKLAGQPTGDSELAIALARSLAGQTFYDPEAVAAVYARWSASTLRESSQAIGQGPPARSHGRGGGTAAGQAPASPDTQLNGSLVRIAPIGVWAREPGHAAAIAMTDSPLTDPHPICVAACGAFAAALCAGIGGADRLGMIHVARKVAEQAGDTASELAATLNDAAAGIPSRKGKQPIDRVLSALQNAFFHLAVQTDPVEAMVATVGCGGDTDTNAAIAGALLGAVAGRAAWPARWSLAVLSCRPEPALGVAHPRPEEYWPDDLLDLAEALLGVRPRQETI